MYITIHHKHKHSIQVSQSRLPSPKSKHTSIVHKVDKCIISQRLPFEAHGDGPGWDGQTCDPGDPPRWFDAAPIDPAQNRRDCM